MREKRDKVAERHKALKELIKKYQIEDQATLVKLLSEHYGITVNQSIISRDLIQCGIGKKKVHDKMVYDLPDVDVHQELLRLAVVDVVHNETMIVIKTVSGSAGFVAEYLDVLEEEYVLGTIAGDNTIFVAPVSLKNIKELFGRICEILYFKKDV